MRVYKHWLDHDVAALAFLIVGIAAVELLAIIIPMANDPPFATLNHFVADLGIPEESATARSGMSCSALHSRQFRFTLRTRVVKRREFIKRIGGAASSPRRRG